MCPTLEQITASPSTGAGAYRNAIIMECIKAIDRNYYQFKIDLHQEAVTGNLITDILSLGLTSGASIAAEKTAQRLSAGGAFVIGTDTAINKDLFFQQTLPALEASMDSRRYAVLTTILESENKDRDALSYTLTNAGIDLSAYEAAGNIYAAISELTKTASVAAAAAKTTLDTAKIAGDLGAPTPLPDALMARYQALVGSLARLPNDATGHGKALALANDGLTLGLPPGTVLPSLQQQIQVAMFKRAFAGGPSDQAAAVAKLETAFKAAGVLP